MLLCGVDRILVVSRKCPQGSLCASANLVIKGMEYSVHVSIYYNYTADAMICDVTIIVGYCVKDLLKWVTDFKNNMGLKARSEKVIFKYTLIKAYQMQYKSILISVSKNLFMNIFIISILTKHFY